MTKLWTILFFSGVFCILISGALRFNNPESNDFEAFYEASNHLLTGQTPYLEWVERPYKYPPVATLLISPLALLEGSVARRLFIALSVAACLFNILLLWRLFSGKWLPRSLEERKSFFIANSFAIFCSLRFLDNEFHSKNINQISYTLLLLGLLLLKKLKQPIWGLLLNGWGSFVKLTPLMGLWTFVGLPLHRRLTKVVLALLVLMFLPWPTMWLDWVRQMTLTTGEFPLNETPLFFQGFFPFVSHFLGHSERSIYTLLFALPFVALVLIKSPRFDVTQLRLAPSESWQLFLRSYSTLVLTSLTLNPLPWQHLYGFLLIHVAILGYLRGGLPGPITSICCAVLALSSRGISGKGFSEAFESNQGIFICVLLIILESIFDPRNDPLRHEPRQTQSPSR